MGILMIKCPQTGREIPTGIKADREKFRCSVVFFARTFCALCQANHEWFAKEAWVSDSLLSSDRLSAGCSSSRRRNAATSASRYRTWLRSSAAVGLSSPATIITSPCGARPYGPYPENLAGQAESHHVSVADESVALGMSSDFSARRGPR